MAADTSRSTGTWRKSSYSSTGGGQCVEIAVLSENVAMRDSRAPEGPALRFPAPEWRSFLTAAARDEL